MCHSYNCYAWLGEGQWRTAWPPFAHISLKPPLQQNNALISSLSLNSWPWYMASYHRQQWTTDKRQNIHRYFVRHTARTVLQSPSHYWTELTEHNVHVRAQSFHTVSTYGVTSFLSADYINTSTSLEVQCLQLLTLSTEQPDSTCGSSQLASAQTQYMTCLLYTSDAADE